MSRSTQESGPSKEQWFRHFAQQFAELVGSPVAFTACVGIVVAWAISGPYFHYSDAWQLVINTGTTIVTFLMVFLIQHTQNRESRVIQMKLDELIRAVQSARTELIQMETLSDEDLDRMAEQFRRERDRAIDRLHRVENARRKIDD